MHKRKKCSKSGWLPEKPGSLAGIYSYTFTRLTRFPDDRNYPLVAELGVFCSAWQSAYFENTALARIPRFAVTFTDKAQLIVFAPKSNAVVPS